MDNNNFDPIESNWREVWVGILMKDGQVDIEQLKKELFDYSIMMREVSKVYCHITNQRISKPNTKAEAVIGEVDVVLDEYIADAMAEPKDDGKELRCLCDSCFEGMNIKTGEGKKIFTCLMLQERINLNNEDIVIKCNRFKPVKTEVIT